MTSMTVMTHDINDNDTPLTTITMIPHDINDNDTSVTSNMTMIYTPMTTMTIIPHWHKHMHMGDHCHWPWLISIVQC